MRDYEVHFNTAATRLYGLHIIQVLKMELLASKSDLAADDPWRNQVELTFNEQRLITRDDKAKYSVRSTSDSQADTYRKAERILASQGVPITQERLEREVDKLNFTKKSLDALAGGDDTFFVILDDRDDVWPTEVKLYDCGVPQVVPSENLLKIAPYFYFDDQHWQQTYKNDWLSKALREVHLEREMDLTLAVYLLHLRRIHSKFFENLGDKEENEMLLDTKFYVRKLKNEVFYCPHAISFEIIIKAEVDKASTYEGHMCDKFNLIMSNSLADDLEMDEDAQGILLVHDKLEQDEENAILAKYPKGRVKLVGALWFYLSIYFNMMLPVELFEPKAQRESRNQEQQLKGLEEGEIPTDSTSTLIRRLLQACLRDFTDREAS